jgi:hypothetical protein
MPPHHPAPPQPPPQPWSCQGWAPGVLGPAGCGGPSGLSLMLPALWLLCAAAEPAGPAVWPGGRSWTAPAGGAVTCCAGAHCCCCRHRTCLGLSAQYEERRRGSRSVEIMTGGSRSGDEARGQQHVSTADLTDEVNCPPSCLPATFPAAGMAVCVPAYQATFFGLLPLSLSLHCCSPRDPAFMNMATQTYASAVNRAPPPSHPFRSHLT